MDERKEAYAALREKVAKAIREMNSQPHSSWNMVADAALAVVKAALAEPDARMTLTANKCVAVRTPDGTWALARDEAARAWRAMLAASPLAEAPDA